MERSEGQRDGQPDRHEAYQQEERRRADELPGGEVGSNRRPEDAEQRDREHDGDDVGQQGRHCQAQPPQRMPDQVAERGFQCLAQGQRRGSNRLPQRDPSQGLAEPGQDGERDQERHHADRDADGQWDPQVGRWLSADEVERAMTMQPHLDGIAATYAALGLDVTDSGAG